MNDLEQPEENGVLDGAAADSLAEEGARHALGEAVPFVALPSIEACVSPVAALTPEPEAFRSAAGTIDPEEMNAALTDNGLRESSEADPAALQVQPTAEASSRHHVTGVTQESPREAEIVLERKHPLAIRWMHWINFPVLFTMIWSGLLIYWNDSDHAYLHPHEVYRLGVGPLTLFRFFPTWFYTNRFWDMRYLVTTGLGNHFFFMWFFALNGISYVAFLLWSKEWKFMVPTRTSLGEAVQVTLVDLHLRKGLPSQTKYNGAQRIAYSAVILMGLGSLVTGLAIYKPTQTHIVTTLLGGYEMARWLHFWLTIGFCAFFLVHVGQVILAGWNNFRSMVSGYEIRHVDEPSLEAERRRF